MRKQTQRGFAQNEPVIVLVIFGILCLILGMSLDTALRWSWVQGLAAGASLLGLGVIVLGLYVWVSIVHEKRAAERRKQK